MPQIEGAEEDLEVEAPEPGSEEEALLHFARYTEARSALPWEQRSFKEKVVYHLDRIFLVFLGLFLLVLMVECAYKMWYVTNLEKIFKFVTDSVTYLLTQEEGEELIEL